MGTDSSEGQPEYSGNDLEKNEYLKQKVEECSAKLKAAQEEIGKEVWGQENVIKLTIACMVAGGHLLSIGVPGLAKTRLVSRMAHVMGLNSKRVQFTPDLMPSDILGSEVLKKDQSFEFQKGPIFTQFFMADEINRASPKTQSALLEAMQEKQVTIAGKTYKLQRPYTVMATQNPIDQDGTYPLPEAQMDRFLMKLDVEYPDAEAERKVMTLTTGTKDNLQELFESAEQEGADLTEAPDKDAESKLDRILGKNDLVCMQKLAQAMPLSEAFQNAVLGLVRGLRPEDENSSDEVKNSVKCGPGPRAHQAFAQAARALALMDGRYAPNAQDIKDLAIPILEHRMIMSYSAEAEGLTARDLIEKQLAKLDL